MMVPKRRATTYIPTASNSRKTSRSLQIMGVNNLLVLLGNRMLRALPKNRPRFSLSLNAAEDSASHKRSDSKCYEAKTSRMHAGVYP